MLLTNNVKGLVITKQNFSMWTFNRHLECMNTIHQNHVSNKLKQRKFHGPRKFHVTNKIMDQENFNQGKAKNVFEAIPRISCFLAVGGWNFQRNWTNWRLLDRGWCSTMVFLVVGGHLGRRRHRWGQALGSWSSASLSPRYADLFSSVFKAREMYTEWGAWNVPRVCTASSIRGIRASVCRGL